MPDLQHRHARRDVLAGDLQRLGNGSHAVIEPNVGIPQRVPEQLGHLRHHVGRHVVVQQHQIQIGVRHELAAAEPAGGHQGETAGGRDPDLGGLGGQPELMEVQQRVAQLNRIKLPLTAFEQLLTCRGQILGGLGRARRRRLPLGRAGGGISCLLCHLSPPAAVAD